MSGDELDLDAIEARADAAARWQDIEGERWADSHHLRTYANMAHEEAAYIAGMRPVTALALVAEVRRLREQGAVVAANLAADLMLAEAEVRRLRAEWIPVPDGLDREKAAGTLWRVACAPLQWVTGPYPDDWPLTGQPNEDDPDDEYAAEDREWQAAAVREFQRANGLAVDGILGPQTWAALRARNESHPYA